MNQGLKINTEPIFVSWKSVLQFWSIKFLSVMYKISVLYSQ